MKRSDVVKALADLASQGKYEVQPAGARKINAIFQEVARVINELEAEETAEDVTQHIPKEAEVINESE